MTHVELLEDEIEHLNQHIRDLKGEFRALQKAYYELVDVKQLVTIDGKQFNTEQEAYEYARSKYL